MEKPAGYVVDPDDPRAPSQAVWDAMSPEERRRVATSLPSEIPRAHPPEGDAHFNSKVEAREALSEWFRRRGRSVYLASELPVYYPDERMFAPDLIAVVDVDAHERRAWVVSAEGRGIDFALEIHVSGDRQKDLEANVERLARLGVPEYFVFEPLRRRITGYRLATPDARVYARILPQGGRWPSHVLELELGLDGGKLRFFAGPAPLPVARELIDRLSAMVDESVARAEEEAARAAAEAERAVSEADRAAAEAARADEATARAERLAAKLRELGIDPNEIE